MVRIHLSSFISKEVVLEKDTASQGLLECAEQLEKLAKEYRRMSEIIPEKKIRVLGAIGSAHCGSIEVDEIDAERLKQYGMVKDYADVKPNPEEDLGAFFIDPSFDTAINLAEEVSLKLQDSNYSWEEQGEIGEDDMPWNYPDGDKLFEGLNKLFGPNSEGPGFTANERQGILQIDIDDLGLPFLDVTYDRVNQIFRWQDPATGLLSERGLEEVASHLAMATALISQVTYSALQESSKVGQVLKFVEDSLRLLEYLIGRDYLQE